MGSFVNEQKIIYFSQCVFTIPRISIGLVICTFHCSEISPLGHENRLVANRQAVSVTRLGEISPFGQIFFPENLPNKSATFCAIFWREIVAIKRELF